MLVYPAQLVKEHFNKQHYLKNGSTKFIQILTVISRDIVFNTREQCTQFIHGFGLCGRLNEVCKFFVFTTTLMFFW